jgi:hypothetical protein
MEFFEGEIPEGEIGEELERFFNEIGQERDRKIRNICGLIDNKEMAAEDCEVLAKYYSARAAAERNGARRLKERVKRFFEEHRITKLDLGAFRPRIIANGGIAPLIVPEAWEREPAAAPEAFQRRVIELDKNAIREALRNDEEAPGCSIAPRGTHLRIR